MSETKACYRDRDNGVYFQRQQHRHDCTEAECRGCVVCSESHCSAAKNCSWHIDAGELTCGRCLASCRAYLRRIGDLSRLMLPAAIAGGVNSEAANLAGPGADYEVFSARRNLDKRWIIANLPTGQHERAIVNLIPDDDEHHPYAVTTRWEAMIREDYGHERTAATSITEAIDYLDRNLHRIAQDDEQDFPLMTRELRKCCQHLEAVLRNDDKPERGAPCPECTSETAGVGPRLRREYGHWCDDEDCERVHKDDETDDVWQCPRVGAHSWSHEAYTRYVEDRKSA